MTFELFLAFKIAPILSTRSGVSLSGLLGRGFLMRHERQARGASIQTTWHRTTFESLKSATGDD
jgi:hypothetical protein